MPHTSMLRQKLGDLLVTIGKSAKHRSLNGDTGYAKALEEVMRNLLLITRQWEMSDANIYGPNEPAIDLIRSDKKIAVQVTVDATSGKVQKTSDKLPHSRYNDTLEKVYVTGLHNCPTGALKNVDHRVQRIRPVDLLAIYNTSIVSNSQIEEAWTYLQNETQLRIILAATDREAFDHILDQLRCGAIRHLCAVEGNYGRMQKRILSLRSLILDGSVSGVDHPGKPATRFENKTYRDFLIETADLLESITHTLDRAHVDPECPDRVYDIGHRYTAHIDKVKLEMMENIDRFCRENGHNHDVKPVRANSSFDSFED